MASFDIGSLLTALPAILSLAQGLGITHTSTGTAVTAIAADVAAITAGGQSSAQTLTEVQQLLTDLHVGGILQGSVMDQAIKVAAVAQSYVSGQVALLDGAFNELGVPGDVFAISKASTNEAAVAFRTAVGL
jgi:hypothetical protein